MGRIYVPSTPASRGEVEVDDPTDDTPELTLEEVTAAAERLGYRVEEGLEPAPLTEDELRTAADAAGFDLAERPAGNASREAWATYARSKGAVDADLVDDEGKDLGRDELREKFGTPPAS